MITAGIDPLVSEGQTLARRLEAVGVPTVQRNDDGVTHEPFGPGAPAAKPTDAQQLVGSRLREAFAPPA